MKANGSSAPKFEFDDDHSYFITRLPVHRAAAKAAPAGDQVGTKWDQVQTLAPPMCARVKIYTRTFIDCPRADTVPRRPLDLDPIRIPA